MTRSGQLDRESAWFLTWNGHRSREPSGQVYGLPMGDGVKKQGISLVMDKLWGPPVWSPYVPFRPLFGSQATISVWTVEWYLMLAMSVSL